MVGARGRGGRSPRPLYITATRRGEKNKIKITTKKKKGCLLLRECSRARAVCTHAVYTSVYVSKPPLCQTRRGPREGGGGGEVT